MSLFSSAVEVPAVTGTDVLRKALYARMFKGALAGYARDLSIGIERLEAFARGQGELPAEIKQRLAREFFNCDYDAERDLLRKQPQPKLVPFATVRPPQYVRVPLEAVVAPRVPPKTTAKPEPKRPAPGWAE